MLHLVKLLFQPISGSAFRRWRARSVVRYGSTRATFVGLLIFTSFLSLLPGLLLSPQLQELAWIFFGISVILSLDLTS